jgi:hypothetical protein
VTIYRVQFAAFMGFGVSLLAVGLVQGNAAPPPFYTKGDAQVSFEEIDKYPEKVFYLRYKTRDDSDHLNHVLVEIKDPKPVKLDAKNGSLSSDVQLLAINRDTFEKLAKDDAKLTFLRSGTAGVAAATMRLPVPTPDKERPLATYRVQLKDGKLTLEAVEEKKGSLGLPSLPPASVIGLAASLCVAGFGLWCVRHRRQD